MNLKKIVFILAACLLMTAIPEIAETYTCGTQGFSFEYDPAYTVMWEDGVGAMVYTGTPEYIPYAIVSRIGKGSMPNFDVDAYIDRDIKDTQARYGGSLLSAERKTFAIDGLELPGVHYIYELDGIVINGEKAKVELMTFVHETDDSVRCFSAKYNPGEGDKTIAAMEQAIRSFTANEIPVVYETFNCDAEGFSFEADSSYIVQYNEDNSMRIYTESEGFLPYASVWCLAKEDASGYDIDDMLAGCTDDLKMFYGERLRTIDDVTIEIGGDEVKGMGYIYDNDQGYGIERLVFIQNGGDSLRQFEARAPEGMIDEALMAMIHAAESFKLIGESELDNTYSESSNAPDIGTNYGSTPTEPVVGFELRPITWEGINIGKVAVPNRYIYMSEIHNCDETTCMGSPVRINLNVMSEDGTVTMSYYAAETYIDRVSSIYTDAIAPEGTPDIQTAIFQKHYLNAAQYCDERAADMNASFWRNEPITNYEAMVDEHYREYAGAVLPDIMRKEWCEVTAAQRAYTYEMGGREWAMCIAAEVRAMQVSYVSMSSEVQTIWEVPGGVFTLICPLEDYERIYSGAFAAFMQNTSMTDKFVEIQEVISNQIRDASMGIFNMRVGQSMAYATAMDTFMSESVDSYLASSSYDTAARFSDYMFDQNTYTTSDGYEVSISTGYDYVWEGDNGMVFYSQYASDMPYGAVQLSPR